MRTFCFISTILRPQLRPLHGPMDQKRLLDAVNLSIVFLISLQRASFSLKFIRLRRGLPSEVTNKKRLAVRDCSALNPRPLNCNRTY